MFEISKLRDGCLDLEAIRSVFELASHGGDHLVPFANRLGQLANVAMVPVTAFVMHLNLCEVTFLNGIEQFNDAKMAANEIHYAAACGIAGVLSFAERAPMPTGEVRAHSL